jgi:hypothetical protein
VKLVVADLHDMMGEPEKGKASAEDVLPVIEAMNYGRLTAHAKERAEAVGKRSVGPVNETVARGCALGSRRR